MNDTAKPKIWVPGDWNAFFGFGTNILVNLLTLTALLRFVLKMPDKLVFDTILPATGMMMCLSTAYYAWLAYGWRRRRGGRMCARCLRGSACRICSSLFL
jgi:AGZA family xanthine/uracil permease-like MFS transporter